MEIEKLIEDVKRKFNKIPGNLEGETGDAPWTREVKMALVKLGESKYFKKGRYIYSAGVDKENGGGEWLYDLCWLDYEDTSPDAESSSEPKLLRMQLALESEWGTDQDVADDFQKLLLSRAALRVMVFGGRNETTKKTVDLLASYVKSFKDGAESDRYLLAGYDGDKIGFSFFVLDGNGDRVDV